MQGDNPKDDLLEHSVSLTLSMDNFKDTSLSDLLPLVFSDKPSLCCGKERSDISSVDVHYLDNRILI